MLDFPANPTVDQVFDKWTWNGSTWNLTPVSQTGGGGGSGFTYVTDTTPPPAKIGDTWFDTSTAAAGGTSWVAIEEAPGGELVWVQFAPGSGIPAAPDWARGIMVMGAANVLPQGTAIAANVSTLFTNTVNFTPLVGRRYRVYACIRAMFPTTTACAVRFRVQGTNSITPLGDAGEIWQNIPTMYGSLAAEWVIDGTGIASTYGVSIQPWNVGITVYIDQPASRFYIEDMGPIR